MDLRDYMRMLGKRWRLVALCTLLAIGAAAALVWRTTPKYEASTQLFVAARDTGGVASGLQSSDQFSQDRVKSYANIINTPEVTAPVAAQLNNGLTSQQIADEISADAPLNTVLVNVHVTDTSATRAEELANAVSDRFATYASQLEAAPGAKSSPVKVTVVKRATLPTAPVSPKKALDLLLGFAVGLVLGVGFAVLRETLDTTVKDPDEAQRTLGLPLLGAIAYDSDAPKRPLIVHADPRSTRAEAFRQLRTNLQFVDIDNSPRSIVVTSSIPEEGKTTTATNLAIALAESGLSVLLVEGDLRRPRMSDYLGIEGAIGLTSVLVGQVELNAAIQMWGKEGRLKILPSGPTPPNPSELLGSQGMVDLLRELEVSYDLVLIDAPPLLPVTDAAVLGSITSGTVVVTRHGHTKIDQLIRAVDTLRAVDAHIYGVVLTMTPTRGPDAYYYGYGYRYDRDAKRKGKTELVTPEPRGARRKKEVATVARASPHAADGVTGSPPPDQSSPVSPGARTRRDGDPHADLLQYFDR